MKKLWLLGMLALFAQPIWAQEEDEDEFSFLYYAGIAGGANINSAEVKQITNLEIVGIYHITPVSDFDADHFSGTGQVQLGAGFKNDYFYLGAELSGQIFDGDFGEDTSSFNEAVFLSPTTLHISDQSQLALNDFELALDLKPGVYLYEHTLVYARIGVGANELELKQNTTASRSPGGEVQIHSHESENVYPLRLGLGLERRFFDDFSIMLDYVYTQYRDISTHGHEGKTFPPTIIVDTSSDATDISRQTVMLGFNYYL